jgi:hypothetical protein
MNAASAVRVVGGLGLFLLGIHDLTEGLKGLAGDSLRRALQTLVGGWPGGFACTGCGGHQAWRLKRRLHGCTSVRPVTGRNRRPLERCCITEREPI